MAISTVPPARSHTQSSRHELIALKAYAALLVVQNAIAIGVVLANHWPLVACWPVSTLPLLCLPVYQQWKQFLAKGGKQ